MKAIALIVMLAAAFPAFAAQEKVCVTKTQKDCKREVIVYKPAPSGQEDKFWAMRHFGPFGFGKQ